MVTELPSTWPAPPSRSRRPRSFWVAWVLLAALLGSLFVNLILLVALLFGFGTAPSVREVVVEGDPAAAEKILLIPVHGLLVEGATSGWGAANPVSRTLRALERAEKDEAIRAIVLDIDSPGGGITDCDRMYHRIQRFRKARPQVPIVVSMGDVAASGGYYIAAPADRIFAHASTITGSIGVIMHLLDVHKLADDFGVKVEAIKSKDRKDIGSPFRPLTEAEKGHFQGMINEMYEQFLQVVMDGRHIPRTALEPLADGNVMTGRRAMEAGLVDAIGYLDDAIVDARQRAKAPGAKVVSYERNIPLLMELFLAQAQPPSPEAEALGHLARLMGERTGRMMYLWWPGTE